MKILLFAPRLPFPPRKGDQAVAYNRMRVLAPRHEITLLTTYERDEELEHLEALKPFCKAIHAVKHTRLRAWAGVAFGLFFSRLPLQALYFKSGKLEKAYRALVSRNRFDVVHGITLRVAPYMSDFTGTRVLDLIDAWKLIASRQARQSKGIRKLLYLEESRRVARFEAQVGTMADHLILVSDLDRDAIGSPKAVTIPLGVDLAPPAARPAPALHPLVVFSGNMSYPPNMDAVEWFARKAWPSIRARVPDAEFHILGGNAGPAVQALEAIPGVKVLGFVPDMAEALCRGWVAVAPMQTGSGMQFKILEALACRLPVVCTRLGLGSIRAEHGREILVADEPEDFAGAVVQLLGDPGEALALAMHGQAFVERRHRWEATGPVVEALYTGRPINGNS